MEEKIRNFLKRIFPAIVIAVVGIILTGGSSIDLTGMLFSGFWAGDVTITLLGLLIASVPVHFGWAVLIRETARRTDRGWYCILLLVLAFAILDTAVLSQSWFSREESGSGVQSLLAVVLRSSYRGLSLWSILPSIVTQMFEFSVSIALAEALFPARRGPWFSKRELCTLGAFVTISFTAIIALELKREIDLDHVLVISWLQSATATIVMIATIVAAFRTPTLNVCPAYRKPLSPVLCGVVSFLAVCLYKLLFAFLWQIHWSIAGRLICTGFEVSLMIGMVGFVLRESAQREWNEMHRLSLAAGASLAYSLAGFLYRPHGVSLAIHLSANLIFALATVALIVLARRRTAEFLRSEVV